LVDDLFLVDRFQQPAKSEFVTNSDFVDGRLQLAQNDFDFVHSKHLFDSLWVEAGWFMSQ
jgi:hypothetical protein